MKLFYAPGACSLAPHILLEEIGRPFEAVRLDFAAGEQRTADYLALNPRGRVPLLVTAHGPLRENVAISAYIAPPALVIASTLAFLLSELVDLGIYTPLQKRGLVLAVAASSVVGLLVDSVIFLWLAFGSLDYLAGQVIGKAWMVLLALPIVALLRRRDARLGLA
jgi:hypothetical protein